MAFRERREGFRGETGERRTEEHDTVNNERERSEEGYKRNNPDTNGEGRAIEDARHYRHYFREGQWYYRDVEGNWILSELAAGAIVDDLPPQTSDVTVEGQDYYFDGSNYYTKLPDGSYVVAEPPQNLPDNAEIVR